MEKQQYDDLARYISVKQYPANATTNQKHTIRKQAKTFMIKGGLLHYKNPKNNKELQVVLDNQKEQVLYAIHASATGGGHFGRDKTIAKVCERYYWKGVVDDVKDYCKHCEQCQRRKSIRVPAELQPIAVEAPIWNTIVGQLPLDCRLVDLSEPLEDTMVRSDGEESTQGSEEDHYAAMGSPIKKKKYGSVGQAWEWEAVELETEWGTLRGKARGTGPRLMLGLHGWLDNANTFDLVAPHIPEDIRFVTLDMPGHGLSDHFPAGFIYDPRGYVGAVKKAVLALGWERFILLGHSMGAVVGIMYTSTFPEDVEAFISVDIIKPWSLKPQKYASEFKKYFNSYFDNECKAKQPPLVYGEEELVQKTIDGSKSLNEEGARILLQRGARTTENGGMILTRDLRAKAYFIGFISFDGWLEMAKSITCPLLILKALDGHHYESKENYDKMLSAFSESCRYYSYHEIGGKHHIHLTRSKEVVELLLPFLKECSSAKLKDTENGSS